VERRLEMDGFSLCGSLGLHVSLPAILGYWICHQRNGTSRGATMSDTGV
jgi:hypothetical protein